MTERPGDAIWNILEYLPVGVCIIDRDYTVHFWNSCMEQWTGKERSEITGTDLRTHFSRINRTVLQERLGSIFTGSPPVIFSSKIHTYIFDAPLQDGTMQRQQTTVLPLEHQSGYYAMFVCEDVTSLTEEIQAYREMKNTALLELEKREKAESNLRVANEDLLAYISEATVRLKTPVSLIEENLREILREAEQGDCDTEELKTIMKLQIQVAASVVENLRELNEAIITGKTDVPAAYRNMIQK
ncbi:PAS domain-containing protein [Methanogenium sp. S4BF]|uniref:PAS domain-containing protein n=1 Tax=Methanogenium sp. S4BF TaxID=1789226 RepID=UPI0024175586|nr:PAS domain-containing protein [Methanogenium sp. S4BF]WFN34424.1 PAS domain-containing protein [Methanogenium sp. S4BF]